MFCNRCGAQLNPQQAFCASCGQAASGSSAGVGALGAFGPNEQERLAEHLHLLSIFWFIVAFLWLLPSGVLFVLGMVAGAAVNFRGPHAAMVHALGPMLFFGISGFLVMIAALCFLTGWGLLKRRPWARIMAIVLGVLSLFHPPFGTALGIYTLWVLLGTNAGPMYDRMAASSATSL